MIGFMGPAVAQGAPRPQQQSSPSDQSVSSGATPPQQTSRASPASTALVMSSNNLHGGPQMPASRQLTPNTANASPTDSGPEFSTGHPQHAPPHPTIRQFACHTKSMSAGVVVPVPGISNHLAPTTGMNQNNNQPNSNQPGGAQANGHQHQFHHRANSHHQQQALPREHRNHNHSHHPHHNHTNQHHHNHRHHHHQQQQQQQQQQHSHQGPMHAPYNPSNQNAHQFMGGNGSTRPTTSSSIILSNSNINNMHNRSSSNQLSSMGLLSANHQSTAPNSHTNSRNFQSNVNNHIWSIDENMSKSHGKLASSGYLPHPYLFNNSITDVSCDNLSNASRLMHDGMPAPGYYLHAPPANNMPNNCQALSASGQIEGRAFLPIYELVFYLITMIIYFCENVFDILALIALYYHAPTKLWALIGTVSLLSANLTCQYLSFRWLYKSKYENCKRKREAQEELENEEDCGRRYYNRMGANMRNYQCGSCSWIPNGTAEAQLAFFLSIAMDAVSHVLCLGFLIRYIKLVIPVEDESKVKKEQRDLSILRIIHAFMQSVPLVFLQAYMICSQTANTSSTSLSTISAILSLVNTCWALATFSKHARKKYKRKFDLTLLGIISQFLWRLGTVSSRIVALTIYAVYYNYWALVVLALHWLTMFFWLLKPGGLFKDEVNITPARKITSAIAVSWIYCFCYLNFEEHNSKIKMTVYYLIMFLENNLLLTVCLIFSSQVTWFKNLSILVVYLGFVFGMMSMCIYYKYFHANILNDGLSYSNDSIDSIADQVSAAGKKIAGFKPGTLRLKSEDSLTSGHIYNSNINNTLRNSSHPEISRSMKAHYLTSTRGSLQQTGAFNCKLDVEGKKQRIQNLHMKHHS